MTKKQLPPFLNRLSQLRPVYLLTLALISGVIGIFGLRANNEHMLMLKQTLYQVDQNNGNVQAALSNLQSYVTAHMNTELTTGINSVYPPIQLAGTYDRLVRAQSDLLQKQNSQIYTDAQTYCEKLHPELSLANRVPCTEQYASSHGIQTVVPIPDSLYKFDFISPRWSPDLAGWSMVISVTSAFSAAGLFIVQRWAKLSSA